MKNLKSGISLSALIVAAGLNSAQACVTTTTKNTMAVQVPCVDNIITGNLKSFPYLQGAAISDANAMLAPSAHTTVQVQAPGMVNVEVWTHGGFTTRLVNDGLDTFSGTIDLSKEPEGPMSWAIVAWNVPAGDPSATVELAARFNIFINPSTWYNWAVIPPQAKGMSIKFIDRFGVLSATPCKPGTGTWPNCTKPTASDIDPKTGKGFNWYENKPNGGDFGAGAFEHTDSAAYNPYSILPASGGGFLRIRSTHDSSYVDPYGFNRRWYTGLLASAFPDGSTNLPMTGNGYYEVRAMMPAASGDGGGGTWPAFWMQTLNAMRTHCASGDIEQDVTEEYGNDPTYTQAGQHPYCGATGKDSLVYAGHPFDLTWDMHRHGYLITDTTVSYYLDDKLMASAPRDQLVGGVAPQWFLMLDLAMGGGWPVQVPPAGYYDMWIDYVRYLAP